MPIIGILKNDHREADESRLREVCESLLGPPTGMAGDAPADIKNQAWDPCVLVRLRYPSRQISSHSN